MNVKTLILSILVFFCFDSYSQKTNILHLKNSMHFSEKNRFWKDTCVTLYQEVNYNEPSVIDEEYCYYLVIQFAGNFDLSKKDRFDLEKDSAFVNIKFKRNSVWDWSSCEKINAGYVNILSRRKNYIEIELSFSTVSDRYKTEYSYAGTRKFIKSKEPEYFKRASFP